MNISNKRITPKRPFQFPNNFSECITRKIPTLNLNIKAQHFIWHSFHFDENSKPEHTLKKNIISRLCIRTSAVSRSCVEQFTPIQRIAVQSYMHKCKEPECCAMIHVFIIHCIFSPMQLTAIYFTWNTNPNHMMYLRQGNQPYYKLSW